MTTKKGEGESDKLVFEVLTVEDTPVETELEGLDLIVKEADLQFADIMADTKKIADTIEADTTVSESEKQELLDRLQDEKEEIVSWYRSFVEKVKETSHDFFRKPGERWYKDHLLEKSEDQGSSLNVAKQNLATFFERIKYIEKKRLQYYEIEWGRNKNRQKEQDEAKAAWISAKDHLYSAGRKLENKKENDSWQKLREETEKAAYLFWNKILSERMPDEKISAVEKLITGLEEGMGINTDFFDSMPEAVQKGFHKAYLEWLTKGRSKTTDNIEPVSSHSVLPYRINADLLRAYPDYLIKSFHFNELLDVLGATKPISSEIKLLGSTNGKSLYDSLGDQGLEDDVANLAIHHAAFRTAGVPPDGWHYEDKDLLAEVREKTEVSLPIFLENLYESLKDFPTALIQAFKGLMKIPTYYYHPAGPYKNWAGYHVYSKEGERISSFENAWSGFTKFEDWSKKMKGYTFDLCTPEDFNVLLSFVLDKGKTNVHFNTLGVMFIDLIGRAAEIQKSDAAKTIDGALVSEDAKQLKKFTALFSGQQIDGGVFFNKYLKRFKKDGIDILSQIKPDDLAVIEQTHRNAREDIFNFGITYGESDNAPELIGTYVGQMRTFIETLGFFNDTCFKCYRVQLTKGKNILSGINDDHVRLFASDSSAKQISIDFFVNHSEQDDAVEVIGEFTRQMQTFIRVIGFFENNCFEIYRSQLDKGNDILATINKELLAVGVKDESVKKTFIKYFVDHGNQTDANELLEEYVNQLYKFTDVVGFFHESAFGVVINGPVSPEQAFAILEKLPENKKIKKRVLDSCEILFTLLPEKREAYFEVLKLIDETPSQEIKRIANELISAIMDSDDPLGSWGKIEDIFIKNNLPLVGKVYKIFKVLHPSQKMDQILTSSSNLSPYLRQSSIKRREFTIFNDLLRVQIESANRNLRQYLEILKEGEEFFEILDHTEEKKDLSSTTQKRLKSYMAKLNTIFSESQIGVAESSLGVEEDTTFEQIKDVYHNLRRSLSIKKEQSIPDRVVEMFASKLGYKSIDEVLQAMKEAKQNAHERGLTYAHEAINDQVTFEEGDVLKGIDQKYIAAILQNGSVAKEYLGAGSSQDETPYDTDVVVVESVAKKSFSDTISYSIAKDYGNILFVVRDRGQFLKTSSETTEKIDPNKLELFKTGVLGEQHYGIRTGFPTTEIDFIVCKEVTKIPRSLEIEIVQNGYYIPVVDQNGKIIFTPQQYESMRIFYAGLDRFDGQPLEYKKTEDSQKQFKDVQAAKTQLHDTKERVEQITQQIQQMVTAVLNEFSIPLKDVFDTSIQGAELLDTGSTGRHTNFFDSFDFDLALKLDLADEGKFSQIVAALKEKCHPDKDNSHEGANGGDLYQLRFEGAHIGDFSLDIDIAFVRKSELVVYGSHDAVKEKLDWVRQHVGDDAYKEVIANIVIAKGVLKKADAYKKQEHGGMGGIGVENWILAYGGNFEQAAKAFWQAAHDESGSVRSLFDFQQEYQIIDPGVNVKFQAHDNFIMVLKEEGYKNMLKAISDYFGWK